MLQNPRLLQITFHTLRHWKATMEYHVRVAKTIDEAKELLEVGFEYVTDMDDFKLFRKRK